MKLGFGFVCCLLIHVSNGNNMYCARDCYEILELSQYASSKEIRKQYRKLSLEYHPDKNPDPQAAVLFSEIATAYEILSDDDKRAAYDYYLAHPNDFAYNYGMYYRHVYAPKTDLRMVVIGFILVLTIIQYLSQNHRYSTALKYFRQSDKVKRKALHIYEERLKENKSKNKRRKTNKEYKKEIEEIIDEVMANLDIQGGYAKPEISNLLVCRIVLLPYSICKYVYWYGDWVYRYRIKKEAYRREDKIYLACRKMGITTECFHSEVYDGEREEILAKEIWERGNYEKYKEEKFEALKAKYPQKYKQMLRQRKHHIPEFEVQDSDSEDY